MKDFFQNKTNEKDLEEILNHPIVKGYNQQTAKQNINFLFSNGATKEDILYSPLVLSSKPINLLIKFALCEQEGISIQTFLRKRLFMASASHLYAQIEFFKSRLVRGERMVEGLINFDKRWTLNEDIYSTYILDDEKKEKILDFQLENFNELC